jgi:hypothetical protein
MRPAKAGTDVLEIKLLPLPGFKPWIIQPVNLVTIPCFPRSCYWLYQLCACNTSYSTPYYYIKFLLLLLLFRLTPVLPEFRARELRWDFPSNVSSACLGCALPVDDYLWRSLRDGCPPFSLHEHPTIFFEHWPIWLYLEFQLAVQVGHCGFCP